uniref:Secreted protein n=1 Tax=Arundo donax TaxID=35708 RepID=A0A0A9ADR7_ARUDO
MLSGSTSTALFITLSAISTSPWQAQAKSNELNTIPLSPEGILSIKSMASSRHPKRPRRSTMHP